MEPQRIFSIKDLNRYIRMKLDSDALLSDVWIRGEISNFTHHSSGHMYFTLKDEGSRILFAREILRLNRIGGGKNRPAGTEKCPGETHGCAGVGIGEKNLVDTLHK